MYAKLFFEDLIRFGYRCSHYMEKTQWSRFLAFENKHTKCNVVKAGFVGCGWKEFVTYVLEM
jgi:hypothetical protein